MHMFLVSDYGRRISGQIIGVDGNTETLYRVADDQPIDSEFTHARHDRAG